MMKCWKLTSFDTFALGMTIKGAWVYDVPLEEGRLGKSLEVLSELYPHLSGRYDGKSKSLRYDAPERLPLSVVDLRDYSAAELIGKARLVWSLIPSYDVEAFKRGRIAPFSATVGRLKEGTVLYVQCAHATMDGQTFYALMRQWAAIYRGVSVCPMAVDQTLMPSPAALGREEALRRVREQGWRQIGLKQVAKMLWNMARNNRIKETFVVEVGQEQLVRYKEESGAGTHAVLSAVAMKRLSEHLRNCHRLKQIQVVDLRGRIEGVGESFFGNCSQALLLNADFEVSDTVAALAKKIDTCSHQALADVDELVRLSVCVSAYGLPYHFFDASDMNNTHPGTIYINNQLKLRACELDFGNGLPLYAFPNDLTDMVKLWQPIADGPIQIIYGGAAAKIMCR